MVSSFMPPFLCRSALHVNAYRLKANRHHPLMPNESQTGAALSVCATNVRALIDESGLSVNAWAKERGLTQSTVNRIVTGKMDPTVSTIEEIAKAVGLVSWQLLAPELGSRLFTLADDRVIPVTSPVDFAARRAQTDPPSSSHGGHQWRRKQGAKERDESSEKPISTRRRRAL
jgi:gp16 family phage-associated protein